MKKPFLARVVIGVILLIIGAALLAVENVDKQVGISLVNAGIIVIGFSLFYHFRYKGKVIKDERTIKIGTKGLAYSWTGTFMLVGVLVWMISLNVVTMTAQTVLSIIMFFMAFSGSLFQFYFSKKEDI